MTTKPRGRAVPTVVIARTGGPGGLGDQYAPDIPRITTTPAIEAAMEADTQYFLDHPGELEYTRPYVSGEFVTPDGEAIVPANGRTRVILVGGPVKLRMADVPLDAAMVARIALLRARFR